jgi:L-ribulose-5-phosphate 4-epimerase
MAYTENEARKLVIQAGFKLVESGLIARTWGNISARISNTQFVITPSGRAYETLKKEDLVVVNIDDCSYSGDIRPSSEKGIHANAYQLRPGIDFVIHTHQTGATIAGIAGNALTEYGIYGQEYERLLGPCVPCAAYGIPSTGKLRKHVAAVVAANPESTAVLMRYHGALCMGKTFEDAFAVSAALEDVCIKRIKSVCGTEWLSRYTERVAPSFHSAGGSHDWGQSDRSGRTFRLVCNGTEKEYNLDNMPAGLSNEAVVHAEIYRHSDNTCIIHAFDPDIIAVSATGQTIKPRVDDLAQIAGVTINCVQCRKQAPNTIVRNLRGRNAVFLERNGALCTGKNRDDAEAVRTILQKGCRAEIYAAFINNNHHLSKADAFLQRIVYVTKYSKQKK